MTTLNILCSALGGYLLVELCILAIRNDGLSSVIKIIRERELLCVFIYALTAYCAVDLLTKTQRWCSFFYGLTIAMFFLDRNFKLLQLFYNAKCEKKTIKCAVIINTDQCRKCKASK